MNETQKSLATQYIQTWMETRTCDVCGSRHWALLGGEHHIAYLPLSTDGIASPSTGIPVLPVSCVTCGYTVLFNPSVLSATETTVQE